MVKLNNKKLQTQRNFQSIWHSYSENIGKLLREDQLIREYIIGTMKAKGWKYSEIIIKRKVNHIHIAFQIQNKIIKERKRWTKNRLKNRKNRLKNRVKRKISSIRKLSIKKRYLFFQLILMITELRKMYPNNNISFYIQKTKPLQFNANLVNTWIIANLKKKKSYKRLLNRIIWKYRNGVEKTKPSIKTINSTWSFLKKEDKKNFLSWITGNLIYLYNVHQLNLKKMQLDNIVTKQIKLNKKKLNYKKIKLFSLTNNISKKIKKNRIDVLNTLGSKISFKVFWWKLKKKRLKKKRLNLSNVKLIKKNTINYKNKLDNTKNKLSYKNKLDNIENSSYSNTIKLKKKNNILNFVQENLTKRNYHTFRLNLKNLVNNPAQIKNGKFKSLNYNQISSKFISFNNQQSKQNLIMKFHSKSLSIKAKLYYIIKLRLAFLKNIKLKKNLTNNKYANFLNLNNIENDKFNIYQDIRSTWKLTRKLPTIKKRLGNIKRHLLRQQRKEFKEDILFLLNYYKFNYLSTNNLLKNKTNITQDKLTKNTFIKHSDLWSGNFLWQGKNFIKFLQLHPPLLDHVIKCLITVNYNQISTLYSNNLIQSKQLIIFLTHVWMGFFDYIYNFENSISKWKGIRILLSGRVGFKKMGRAKKYYKFWGSLKNSSARLPLQYSYSQIYTRYGVIGVKLFIR